mmetsp:Transcript_25452/g.30820  ORF Transcript_25452/g.30820 Transcript_25452/m.30820 type:complete len:366 (+) Transcript_25452:94-1191(+)|eukprot:CAMPEP_0172489270 /NCGR_PEP_ID=MMETSP1066-20121228/19153_1 /TAXON_ID=671091 /ORGANISM="Coscinodiscus wailesii, Strain CCMP2513" /LENGTH=365 /DNA_ID=CAMNT_0013256999 /DNA_START=126 /DNA_END=1223 /DNA_ORIENTATION=+
MKLNIALVVSGLATAVSIKSNSPLGQKILSQARRLDEDDAVDMSWLSGYSLKFNGCHHVSQWNNDAADAEDVRVMMKRLARFRLCPSDTCSADEASGCSSGYGDYVLDMNTYVEAYVEAKREALEEACEEVKENCGCEDNGDDAYDEEACEYQCYVDAGLEDCYREEGAFEPEQYTACAQYEPQDGDDGGRRLDEGDDAVQYFIGPYCANQGGDVYLGMFTDDTCTEFADDLDGSYLFKQMSGESLPYSSKSMVGSDCVSCLQAAEGDDDAAEDEASEACQALYMASGKCESNLSVDYPNENACAFMSGITIVLENGVVNTEEIKASPTASVFIGIFAASFCLLAFYVYYLNDKMNKTKTNLAES